MLLRYTNERFLYRLSVSEHAASFVLKGAALFSIWIGHPHRATRDSDLLGFGEPSEARLQHIFSDLFCMPASSDGNQRYHCDLRETKLDTGNLEAFWPAFSSNSSKLLQWQAFQHRIAAVHRKSLQQTIDKVRKFAEPVLHKAAAGT